MLVPGRAEGLSESDSVLSERRSNIIRSGKHSEISLEWRYWIKMIVLEQKVSDSLQISVLKFCHYYLFVFKFVLVKLQFVVQALESWSQVVGCWFSGILVTNIR